MKKVYLFLIFIVLSAGSTVGQIGDKITQLPPDEVKNYATPLATWTGTYFNSGGYYTASVPKTFGFKLSIVGMMIFIPESQRTFNINPYEGYDGGETSATFFGQNGAAVAGPEGFIVYPPGVNMTSVPAGIPQVSFGFIGIEAMLRYFPKLNISDVEVNLLGWGLKYNFSQLIPGLPLDIAAQILWNNFEANYNSEDGLNDADMKTSNFAFNVHASKGFGMLTVYGGLQYESTTLDLNYVYSGSGFPGVDPTQYSVSMDGENNMRLTLGAAVKLALIVLNVDYNIGSQNALVGGLTFEF